MVNIPNNLIETFSLDGEPKHKGAKEIMLFLYNLNDKTKITNISIFIDGIVNWYSDNYLEMCEVALEITDLLIEKTDSNDLIQHINKMANGLVDILGICHDDMRHDVRSSLQNLLSLSLKDAVPILAAALHHEHWKVVYVSLICLKAFLKKSPNKIFQLLPRVQELLNSEFEPLMIESRSIIDKFNYLSDRFGIQWIYYDEIDIYRVDLSHEVNGTPNPSTPHAPEDNPKKKPFTPNGYTELKFLRFFDEMVIRSEPEMSVKEVNKEMNRINSIILNVKLGCNERRAAFYDLWYLVQEGGAFMKARLSTLERAVSRAIIDPEYVVAVQACVFTAMISIQVDNTFVSRKIISHLISLLYDSCKTFSDLGLFTLKQIILNTWSPTIFDEIAKLHSSKYYKIRRVASTLLLIMLSNWPSSFLLNHQDEIRQSINKNGDYHSIFLNREFESFFRHLDFWKEFTPSNLPHYPLNPIGQIILKPCVDTEDLSSNSIDIKEAGQCIRRVERLMNVCHTRIKHFSQQHRKICKTLTKIQNDYDQGLCSEQKVVTKAKELHATLKVHLLEALGISEQSLEMQATVQTDHRVFKVYRAGAIIFSEFLDKVLLVKSSAGENKTGFPKGACDCHILGELESFEYAAAREVKEEATHRIDDHLDSRSFIDVDVNGSNVRLFVVFRPIPKTGAKKATSDVME